MKQIIHLDVYVNSDQKEIEDYPGDLNNFACFKLNKKLQELNREYRVISISDHFYESEVRPRQDNSSTWYTRENLSLSVYIEITE